MQGAAKTVLSGLPSATTERKDLFSEFGEVSYSKVIIDRDTNRSKGFGFVEFEDDAAAKAAIAKLDGSEMNGRNIVVNEARPREDNRR